MFRAPTIRARLDRVDPDAADAHHHHGVTVAVFAGVDRTAIAGGHAAAHQRGLVQREALVDLDHRLVASDPDVADVDETAQFMDKRRYP